MKRHHSLCIIISVLLLLVFVSCKKSSNKNSSITIANISGTYKLSALIWVSGGLTFNVYDSLPACEKDNEIQLNTDLSANYIDAGITCNPPENSTGNWYLSADSLYLNTTPSKIKSFDGTTLVITGYPNNGGVIDSTVIGTTTLTKI